MSIIINYNELWTYSTKVPTKQRKKEEVKLPLTYLDKYEYTHIHGDLQIIINNNVIPNLGIDSKEEVCLGYWIEMLSQLFESLKRGVKSYAIEGGEQGKPAYLFEKDGEDVFLSIIDSLLGGKGNKDWQKVQFKYSEFKEAFNHFKIKLLDEVKMVSPDMVEFWEKKFT